MSVFSAISVFLVGRRTAMGTAAMFAAGLTLAACTGPQEIEVPPADEIAVDERGAAERLSGSVRFRTVSHGPGVRVEGAAFLALHDFLAESYPRVHTTLDMALQRVAAEATREAMAEVDERIATRYARRKAEPPQAQMALIAIDPHTGAVKALVGGRDYNQSQLNHVTAHRQPGSLLSLNPEPTWPVSRLSRAREPV